MSAISAATRPTRRDMRAHPWRTIAGVLMIIVPVALILAGYTYYQSTSVQQNLTRMDNRIQYLGSGDCTQSIDGSSATCTGEPTTINEYAAIKEALPNFTPVLTAEGGVTVHNGERTQSVSVTQVSYAPNVPLPAPGEVLLPRTDMASLGVSEGDTITVDDFGIWTVAGPSPGYQAVVAAPTLVDPDGFSSISEHPAELYTQWFAVGADRMTWDDVLALNKAGFTVNSQDVIDNPPPLDQVEPEYRDTQAQPMYMSGPYDIIEALFMGVAIVMLFLFIMPVFSVAASKQARTYALMRSQGATAGHVRATVASYGLLTGLVGGTIGVILGVAVGAGLFAARFPGWPVHVDWVAVLAVWLGAVIGATLAAFIPAVITARQPLAAAVAGGTPDKMLKFSTWMLIGPVLIAVGAGMLTLPNPYVQRAFSTRDNLAWADTLAFISMMGWPVVFVGLAGCAPLIVYAVSRVRPQVGLAPHLALRDIGRQALRSIPTMALIIAVAFLTSAMFTSQMATFSMQRTLEAETYNPTAIRVTTQQEQFAGSEQVEAAVRDVEQIVGPTQRADVYTLGPDVSLMPLFAPQCVMSEDGSMNVDGVSVDEDPEVARECYSVRRSSFLSSPWFSLTTIASPDVLTSFTFDNDADRTAAQQAAGESAYLVAKDSVAPGTYEIEVFNGSLYNEDPEFATMEVEVRDVLPANEPYGMLSPALADEVLATWKNQFGESEQAEPMLSSVVLSASRPLTATQRSELQVLSSDASRSYSAWPLQSTYIPPWIGVATGAAVGLLILVAIAFILMLSTQTTSQHFAVLSAVGAAPNLPRRVTGLFAAFIALLGTLFGAVAGWIIAWIMAQPNKDDINGMLLSSGTRPYVVVDWQLALMLLVVVPLLAYGLGMLFHRDVAPAAYRET